MNDNAVVEAEAILNATVIAKPGLLDEFSLEYTDFADANHALVYRTVKWLHEQDRPVSMPILIEKLANRVPIDILQQVGAWDSAQPWAAAEHARIIREAAKRRRMVSAAYKLMELARESERIDESVQAEIERVVSEIDAASETERGPKLLADIVGPYADTVEYRYKHKGELTGVNTGFEQLNKLFGGWRPTDLCIVAARPSMGKTAFMLQTALSASKQDVVVMFSLEMGQDPLMDRMTAAESQVSLYHIHNGRIDGDEWPKIADAIARLGGRNMYIDVSSGITVSYMRSHLRKIARKLQGKRMVVFVDYMQIMKPERRGRTRTEEIGEVSTELKALAKDLNCCVVALAQLSRDVEKRSDKRPTLADIRESGQIEQDADIISFLYRDEYYNPETTKKNVVEVIIGKNRNGPVGTADLVFLKDTQRILELGG